MAFPIPPPLIEALIAGLCEEPLWATFLDRLRAALAADYASITFRPPGGPVPFAGTVHLYSGVPSPPGVGRLYRERLHLRDPVPYHALDAGRVYALAELLDRDEPQHEAYRRALLAPSGMNQLRMMRFEDAAGHSGWLSASRRARDFGADDDGLIAALCPLLAAALAAHAARERERTQAQVSAQAIRRMNFGWLTLDAAGRIRDADGHAEALLADPAGPLLRDRGGRLKARAAEANRAIAESVAAADQPPRRSRAVVLARQPWIDMLLVPLARRPSDVLRAATIAVYVRADRRTAADHKEHLGTLFDLTPREAELALALSRGMSIREAAAEMGLTVASARTYTKRIFAKTGARGQPDLIRFLHHSVTALT